MVEEQCLRKEQHGLLERLKREQKMKRGQMGKAKMETGVNVMQKGILTGRERIMRRDHQGTEIPFG